YDDDARTNPVLPSTSKVRVVASHAAGSSIEPVADSSVGVVHASMVARSFSATQRHARSIAISIAVIAALIGAVGVGVWLARTRNSRLIEMQSSPRAEQASDEPTAERAAFPAPAPVHAPEPPRVVDIEPTAQKASAPVKTPVKTQAVIPMKK